MVCTSYAETDAWRTSAYIHSVCVSVQVCVAHFVESSMVVKDFYRYRANVQKIAMCELAERGLLPPPKKKFFRSQFFSKYTLKNIKLK